MNASDSSAPLGVLLPNGTRITHGEGGNVRRPMQEIPLVMHELYAGADAYLAFRGQFGFIEFDGECRLPRHVHIGQGDPGQSVLLRERILVMGGVGLAELGGEIFVVAPGSLVDIPAGLPHTWTACPAGVALPDGRISDGRFTMIYNYVEETQFFPTAQTETLARVEDYRAFEGDTETIRFPALTAEAVGERCSPSLEQGLTPHGFSQTRHSSSPALNAQKSFASFLEKEDSSYCENNPASKAFVVRITDEAFSLRCSDSR